jgi:hypothetical protein
MVRSDHVKAIRQGVEAAFVTVDTLRAMQEQQRLALAETPDVDFAATHIDGGVLRHLRPP